MPPRLIDYPALWSSSKLAKLEREEDRLLYLWCFGLADSHYGVFERDSLMAWQICCAYLLPSQSPNSMQRLFENCERAKLLFPWESGEKRFGHWTGITKAGRLPPRSQLQRSQPKLPPPPKNLLDAFLVGGGAAERDGLFSRPIVGFMAGAPAAAGPAAPAGSAAKSSAMECLGESSTSPRTRVDGVGLALGEMGLGGVSESVEAAGAPSARNSSSPASLSLTSFAPPPPAPPCSAQMVQEKAKAKGDRASRDDSFFSVPKAPMRYDDAPFLDSPDSLQLQYDPWPQNSYANTETPVFFRGSNLVLTVAEGESLTLEFSGAHAKFLPILLGCADVALGKIPIGERACGMLEFAKDYLWRYWPRGEATPPAVQVERCGSEAV